MKIKPQVAKPCLTKYLSYKTHKTINLDNGGTRGKGSHFSRPLVPFLFLCLSAVFSGQAHAFRLLGFHWPISEANPVICWALHPTIPASVTQTADVIKAYIRDNIQPWEDVSTSYLRFQECAWPSADATSVAWTNVILFRVRDDVPESSGGCGMITPEGVCTGANVALATATLKASASRIRYVITHEVGHAIGLHHSDRPSIMSYHKPSMTLTTDDVTALTYLYPIGEHDNYNAFGCGSLDISGSSGGGPGSKDVSLFMALVVMGLAWWATRLKPRQQLRHV